MLHILSVWIHVLAGMVWIGGMAFVSLVLVPALRKIDNEALRAELLRTIARKFRGIAWISILVLLGTGVSNLWLIGQWPSLQTAFGRLLAVKLAAIGLMLALTVFHDVAASAGRGLPAGATRWLPRAGFILGLVVVLFAVSLSRT